MTKIDEILHFLFDDINNEFIINLQVKFCWWAWGNWLEYKDGIEKGGRDV
jgi:hypothetical protein